MADAIKDQIAALESTIRGAVAKAEAGASMDLTDVKKKVEALCRDVTRAKPAAAHALRPALLNLITQLGELEQKMRDNMGKAG